MNTPSIIIEISNSAIKILVGTVLNDTPVIYYATSKPTNGLIKNGAFVDIKDFVELLKDISHIEDHDALVRFNINKAILVLPAIGLDIFEDKKSNLVVSKVGKIDRNDIFNLINMINKNKIKSESSFVDIIPMLFYVDRGQTENPPIGVTSNALGTKAIIYTLPTQIINSYRGALENAGIRVRRSVVAPHAVASLLSRDPSVPNSYIYVDVGADVTTLSLISKKFVYNSSYFLNGGNRLTSDIAEAFNCDLKQAEKLKRHYGYDARMLSFSPVISSSKSSDGKEVLYTVKDLNNVIKNYLDNYIYSFDTCLNNLLSAYSEDKRNFPIIIGGAASRLAGFVTYFKEKYPTKDIRPVPLKIVGARHQKYINLVGALLSSATYTGSLEDSRTLNSSISRAGVSSKKTQSINVDDDVL